MEMRKLEELNLLDDYLMYTLVNHQKYGEEFSRIILKTILGRNFKKLKIIPQKVYYGSDTSQHGARLDVYLEEEADGNDIQEQATICDIEPEQNAKKKNVSSLPWRARFYHSKIDIGSLPSGVDYDYLKNVIVIFITPFDPFGYNQMMYTIENQCREVPEMPYEDGAKTLFLYTKGELGNANEELQQLLIYMEKSVSDNVRNDNLEQIHDMVTAIKQESEVSLEYMRIMKSKKEWLEEEMEEVLELKERERQRAEAEKERAEAEKERAEAEKERAEAEKERAEAEKERAEAEKERAEAAEKKVEAAEAEIQRLKTELAALRQRKL